MHKNVDTTLTGCKSKSGQSGPFHLLYSFEGQSAPTIDTKFAMSPIHLKNLIFPKFVQFQFLHFNAEHSKSIAVLGEISVPAKHCQELYCAVHELLGKSVGFSIFRLICMGNKVAFC